MNLECPYCGESILYRPDLAGQSTRCSWCKNALKMPSEQELSAEQQEQLNRERQKAAAKRHKRDAKTQRQREQEQAKAQRQREWEQARLQQAQFLNEQEQAEVKWEPVAPLPHPSPARNIWNKPLGCGTIILLCFVVCAGLCTGLLWDGGSNTNGPSGNDVEAWTVMQEFVTDKLVSPSSAEFPWCDVSNVTNLGGGRYKVKGYVDSENSFGAMIRTDFEGVVVNKGGGSWGLESLQVGSAR